MPPAYELAKRRAFEAGHIESIIDHIDPMAPEQARGQTCFASDMYGAAAVQRGGERRVLGHRSRARA